MAVGFSGALLASSIRIMSDDDTHGAVGRKRPPTLPGHGRSPYFGKLPDVAETLIDLAGTYASCYGPFVAE
ncbi:hypothetical protein GCM10009665_10900 [Kitasatospora nipponensis]|uniref:Uncharacterized protein n=1 Tax=Kitasatospora nipponensis TaxID=258049 RepID=A0ABP4GH85_9ACTN